MKNIFLGVITLSFLLMGCFASKKISTNMAESMLLVSGNSAKIKQAFRSYKFPYKLLGKNDDYTEAMEPGKTNYLLREGDAMQRGTGAASPTYVEIILENLNTKETVLLTNVTGGMNSGAMYAVRKLMKMNGGGSKKK